MIILIFLITIPIIFFFLGASLYSFASAMHYRYGQKEKKQFPIFSHCEGCRRRLTALQLLPVFGYLYYKGECPHCHYQVPKKYMLGELVSGIIAIIIYLLLLITFTDILSYL